MRVGFGEYQLDTQTRTLQREGRRIPVQSKAFDLLAYLIERRERVVSSNELLDALWPGLHVTPAALSTAVQKARQAVGDDGEHQAVLQTEHGKGFRFVAEVTDLTPWETDLSMPEADPSVPEAAQPNQGTAPPTPETNQPGSAGVAQLPLIAELKRRNVFRVAAAYGIVAWLLVEVASVVLPTFEAPNWVMKVLTFLVILGFPPALILAWVFELTPEGIKLETAVDRAKSITRQTGRKLDFAIIGLLAIALIFVVVDQYVLEAEPKHAVVAAEPVPVAEPVARGKSIAVLPFVNMSADADQEYFADGISEELLNTLAQFEDLRVVGRTSSFSFKGSDADLTEIGETLNAGAILEGSVRMAGDRVRITAQLVDAKDGFHRWSETYDRELTDIFAIQTEIATAIADALERLATPPTENLEAYQAYLLGKQHVAKFNNATLAESIDHYQRAIELDPNFALAYAGLAEGYFWQTAISGLPRDQTNAKAKAAIDKAIALDDQLGEAYAMLATLKHEENDIEGAEAAFQRALELNPNYATTHNWYGFLLRDASRPEEALASDRKAVELDPLSAVAIISVGLALNHLGRFDEALVQFEKALEIDPDFAGAHDIAAHYWLVEGKLDEAVVWIAKDLSLDPGSPIFSASLGMLFLDLGDPNEGEYWIKRSSELGPGRFWPDRAMQLLRVYKGDEVAEWNHGKGTVEISPLGDEVDWPNLTLLPGHELRWGRYPEGRLAYATSYSGLLNRDAPKVDNWNYQAAIDLALVLSRAGEQAHADLLLNRSLQYIQPLPRLGEAGYGIADVEIYALQGNKPKALWALRQAIDEGWRGLWWYFLEHDPNLESLHDEPEYRAMVAEIETDMAEQLAHVREMKRNGELAAIHRDKTNLH
jgi:TolB-like protein/DNA-binding winged helix-turn-helix (wHTH) protein/Tfp pilus assembly protein PilF